MKNYDKDEFVMMSSKGIYAFLEWVIDEQLIDASVVWTLQQTYKQLDDTLKVDDEHNKKKMLGFTIIGIISLALDAINENDVIKLVDKVLALSVVEHKEDTKLWN